MELKLWKVPKIQSKELGTVERHATWTELFYDLAFVVAIAVIAHDFSNNLTKIGLCKFFFLFIPIWHLWLSATIYVDRFNTDDLGFRAATLIQMIGITGLAVFAHEGLDKTFSGFVISYMIVRFVIMFNYYRGGKHNKGVRKIM